MQFSRKDDYRNYFVERFGISQEIMGYYSFWQRSQKVWAFSGTLIVEKNIEILGIKALTLGKVPKPSTAFLRVIGRYATQNVVTLNTTDTFRFLRGEELEGNFPVEQGYVIVKTREDILGCGFYAHTLKSLIPKKYRLQDTWI